MAEIVEKLQNRPQFWIQRPEITTNYLNKPSKLIQNIPKNFLVHHNSPFVLLSMACFPLKIAKNG